jgi:LPXTG-site transpeptidase (sortase) family protein
MSAGCPYLCPEPDPRPEPGPISQYRRCFVRGRAEHVGMAYQAQICMRAGYSRCARLPAGWQEAGMWRTVALSERPLVVRASARSSSAQTLAAPESPLAVRASARSSGAQPRTTDLNHPHRRPASLSMIETLVLGLGASILVGILFVGYAIMYRIQLGPGLVAPNAVAGGVEVAISVVHATLVPTFTLTLLPTATATPGLTATPEMVSTPGVTAMPGVTTTAVMTVPQGLVAPMPKPAPQTSASLARIPATSPPTRLVIPKIDLDIPVMPVGVKVVTDRGESKPIWGDVANAGAFHQTSAYPGNVGNTVINGHRDIQGSVFLHLDRLTVGDEITVYVGDVAYPYRVTVTLVVPETFASDEQRAENQRLIGYMPEERLTLITCTPLGLATHRLLVIAKPPD